MSEKDCSKISSIKLNCVSDSARNQYLANQQKFVNKITWIY